MRPTPPITGWLIALLFLWGCRPSTPPPWTLIELGNGSVAEAMINGWIAAEVDQEIHWLRRDEDNNLATLARDLHSLPDIACGDLIRLSPADLPLSIRDAFGWRGRVDSMTVRWHCHDQNSLSRFFQEEMGRDSTFPSVLEQEWIHLLRMQLPDERSHGGQDIRAGEEVTLSISTTRADGRPLKPQTVSVTFNMGDADQVVPAIERELSRTRSNSQWTVWANSADAFGEEAHPELGLPPHMPLRFTVRVE